MRTTHELSEVIESIWSNKNILKLSGWQIKTLDAIRKCRTAALGGHIDSCNECGHLRLSYNSCRNRHCPKCQGNKREEWIDNRMRDLLPVPYFHIVFTLPSDLNNLCLQQPRVLYNILFDASWKTIEAFSKDSRYLGAKTGMISVLHTWGQNLSLHPHVHCIVPGGGVLDDGTWINVKSKGKYLFPVKAMSKMFRGKFIAALRKVNLNISADDYKNYHKKLWVVYAKKPFRSTYSVIEYLGRYTHKIAISNSRIIKLTDKEVSFTYKDYAQSGTKKVMTLSNEEFIRRFSLHILDRRFVRIRHYGILSSTWKRTKFKSLQKSFKIIPILIQKNQIIPDQCPCCKKGKMIIVFTFGTRGPPTHILDWFQNSTLPNSY